MTITGQSLESYAIERIYAAATNEINWGEVVPDINRLFRSSAGGFFFQDDYTHHSGEILLLGFASGVMEKYNAYYNKINPWFSIPGMMAPNCVRTENDVEIYYRKKGGFEKTEFFNDWMRPHAMDHAIGGSLTTRGSFHLNFTMFRNADIGAYTALEIKQLQRLFPHLRRAMEVGEVVKMALARDRVLLEGLDSMGIGLAILDANQNVLDMNTVATRMVKGQDGLSLRQRKLYIAESGQRASLMMALSALGSQTGLAAGVSPWIFVSRHSGKADYQLMVLRSMGLSAGMGVGARTHLVLLIDPASNRSLPRVKIQRRYKFTDRETDVALCLLQGKSVKEIARSLNFTYESARWYVKQVCQKGKCATQTQFIAQTLAELSLVF